MAFYVCQRNLVYERGLITYPFVSALVLEDAASYRYKIQLQERKQRMQMINDAWTLQKIASCTIPRLLPAPTPT